MGLKLMQYCNELSLLSYNNDLIFTNQTYYKDFYFKNNNYNFFNFLNKNYNVINIKENITNYKDYKFNGLLYKIYNQNKIENPNLNLLRLIMTENNKFLMNGFLSNNFLFGNKEFVSKQKINRSSFHLNLDLKNETDEGKKFQKFNNQNWSISSSSNEDELMINKRLNEQLDTNTLSTSSSSFTDVFNLSNIWNTNLKLLEKLHLNLDKFIYSDNSSFSQIGGNLDTPEKIFIYFNKKKSHIIIIKNPVIEKYMIVSANIFLSNHKKNKLLSLSNINILVDDGSTFFVEDERKMSPNLLINYLQKIKKNNKSDDSLIFCFNILKLYNHINNENLSIYLNLFNYNSDTWAKNPSIGDNIILRSYKNDKLSKDVTDDIRKFNSYVCQHQYKEANELLNKYNSDNKINKKVNKDFLKIIFELGWSILDEDVDYDYSISDYSDYDYSGSDYV